MNIIERLIDSQPQMATMLMSLIILSVFSLIVAMFHGMEMALWLFKQKLMNNHVGKGVILKETIFGILLLSIVHILLLYVIHTSNIGHKTRFEVGMWQYVVVFFLGISLYIFFIWKAFKRNT